MRYFCLNLIKECLFVCNRNGFLFTMAYISMTMNIYITLMLNAVELYYLYIVMWEDIVYTNYVGLALNRYILY